MKIFDNHVKVGDMDCLCVLSVKSPYGTRKGFADLQRKRKWCIEQGWVHGIDYRHTRSTNPVDFEDWSDYKWWFTDVNKAYWFLLRWSS